MEGSLACLAENHLHVLQNYPVSSPDLNGIEGVWALLRTELNEEAPASIESREAFIVRLRAAVRRLNTRSRQTLLSMCDSMQDRARDVLKLKGARTSW